MGDGYGWAARGEGGVEFGAYAGVLGEIMVVRQGLVAESERACGLSPPGNSSRTTALR